MRFYQTTYLDTFVTDMHVILASVELAHKLSNTPSVIDYFRITKQSRDVPLPFTKNLLLKVCFYSFRRCQCTRDAATSPQCSDNELPVVICSKHFLGKGISKSNSNHLEIQLVCIYYVAQPGQHILLNM